MGEMATLVEGTPGSRQVSDLTTVPLLRRVVESAAQWRPGRYTVYLGRPDPAAVRAEWDQEVALLRCARRAVVTTPDTTPLPREAGRAEPGLGRKRIDAIPVSAGWLTSGSVRSWATIQRWRCSASPTRFIPRKRGCLP